MTAPTRRRLLAAAIAGGLLPPGVAAAARSQATSKPSPRRLGVLLPRGGAPSLAADEAWRGIVLAYESLSASRQGAIDLVPLGAGSPSDASHAVAAFAKTKGAAGIIGTASSSLAFAATGAAELADLPYVEIDSPASGLTGRGFKHLLRTAATTTDFAGAARRALVGVIAPAWRTTPDRLTIALLFDIGATDGAFAAAMIDALKASGAPPRLRIAYPPDAADLASEVGRMKRAGVDLVIHAGGAEAVVQFYQAMVVQSWRPRLVLGAGAGYALAEPALLMGAGFDDTMVVGPPPYAVGAAAADVAARYRRRFATTPRGAPSLTAYVGALLVFDALQSGKRLEATLRAIRRPRGALANGWGVAFDDAGQNDRSYALLQQWQQGQLAVIDPSAEGAARPRFGFGRAG